MNYAVILAGGAGTRAGGPLPKQFQMVGTRRMLWWSVDAFRAFDPSCRIVLVIHPDFLSRWDDLFAEEERERGLAFLKVAGGKSRIASVRNALESIHALEKGNDRKDIKVFIHDAARPFVTPALIGRGAATVSPGRGAVPVVPLSDSIRKITPEGSVSVDRGDYASVQTPQIFHLNDIYWAYAMVEDESGLTDDASVAERSGVPIDTFEGDAANFKITNPSDFSRNGA